MSKSLHNRLQLLFNTSDNFYDFDNEHFTDDYLDLLEEKNDQDIDDQDHKQNETNEVSMTIGLTCALSVIAILTSICVTLNCKFTKGGFRFLLACKAVVLVISCLLTIGFYNLFTYFTWLQPTSESLAKEALENESNSYSVSNGYAPEIINACMNLECIFTLQIIYELYKRVCFINVVEFSWSKLLACCLIFCGSSIIKDSMLMTFLNHTTFKDDAVWKQSFSTLNSLAMTTTTASICMFCGVKVVLTIWASQKFRSANAGKKDKNHMLLVKMVAWMLFSNILRVGASILRIVKSGEKFETIKKRKALDNYDIKMNGMFMDDSSKESSLSWSFVADMPTISIGLGFTDQLVVTTLKLCFG